MFALDAGGTSARNMRALVLVYFTYQKPAMTPLAEQIRLKYVFQNDRQRRRTLSFKLASTVALIFVSSLAGAANKKNRPYPPEWWAEIPRSNAASWEILPQDAMPGEVILSKRTELGIFSNFAATPFELDGKKYASVEGFWQMMKYPEGTADERLTWPGTEWKFTREQVAGMVGFEAKRAGDLAEINMKKMVINWVTYQGRKMPYRVMEKAEHYKLIRRAMQAKFDQNPELRRTLKATGDLILRPDHHQGTDTPPAWKYYEIWMEIRHPG